MNLKNIIFSLSIICFLGFNIFVTPASAALSTNIDGEIIKSASGEMFDHNLGDYFSRIIQVAIVIAAVAAFAMLIWGGIEWTTSGGDKSKYEAAGKRMTAAIIGLILTASSFALWYLVITFLNINKIPQLQISKNASQPIPKTPAQIQACILACNSASYPGVDPADIEDEKSTCRANCRN